ncbi:MAG TPA: DUF1223 domain-containing protein [Candidatus Acidoferrales bacterium]|jgi:hypothetical protein|nr:DUF1223 domain-containing protein [Candidatus Acidoferrales bacterium]
MKVLSGMAFKLCLAFSLCLAFVSTTRAQSSATKSERKPVIVELFTSEGCSTCPPADELLQKLEAEQPVAGAEIVALEEHVDYWNHDGWNDPYSSADWTERQTVYRPIFNQTEYTPQMIVDGQSQFVGSNGREALAQIEKAAHREPTDISINSEKSNSHGSQQFTVSVGKVAGNTAGDVAEIWLAVTEDGLQSTVNRGENAGHVLHHTATLRSLHKIGTAEVSAGSVSFKGDSRVKFDSHWKPENLHVVVFVQEKKSRKILGAGSAKVSP